MLYEVREKFIRSKCLLVVCLFLSWSRTYSQETDSLYVAPPLDSLSNGIDRSELDKTKDSLLLEPSDSTLLKTRTDSLKQIPDAIFGINDIDHKTK